MVQDERPRLVRGWRLPWSAGQDCRHQAEERSQSLHTSSGGYLETDASSGTVDNDKVADLVLLDANPLDDIRNTTRIAAVIVRGRLFDRAALDALLADAEKTAGLLSIAETLEGIIGRDSLAAAVASYHDLKARQPATHDFTEPELNGLGYRLLRAKKLDEAVRIFELNVEAYPQSANAYDSLGEAFMVRGDRDRAIANYRKSLELDPGNINVVQQLEKLGATH
jgi:tetratricopeptide (TPR) repeat protein